MDGLNNDLLGGYNLTPEQEKDLSILKQLPLKESKEELRLR